MVIHNNVGSYERKSQKHQYRMKNTHYNMKIQFLFLQLIGFVFKFSYVGVYFIHSISAVRGVFPSNTPAQEDKLVTQTFAIIFAGFEGI